MAKCSHLSAIPSLCRSVSPSLRLSLSLWPGLIVSRGLPLRRRRGLVRSCLRRIHPSTAAENRISEWNQRPWRNAGSVEKLKVSDVCTVKRVAATCGPRHVTSVWHRRLICLSADQHFTLCIHSSVNMFVFLITCNWWPTLCPLRYTRAQMHAFILSILFSVMFPRWRARNIDQQKLSGINRTREKLKQECNCWWVDVEIKLRRISIWALSVWFTLSWGRSFNADVNAIFIYCTSSLIKCLTLIVSSITQHQDITTAVKQTPLSADGDSV